MALGKRLVTQARVVLREDSALLPETDYEKYVDGQFDWDHLKLKTDVEPTVFVVKPLTYRQREELAGRDSGAATFLVRCGLLEVKNYLVGTESGQQVLSPVEHEHVGELGKLVTPSWLEKANFPDEHLVSIVAAIQQVTQAKLPLS